LTKIPADLAGTMPDGTEVWRPRLWVTVGFGKKSFRYQAIVDSGADNSIATADLMETIGAKWEKMTDPHEEMGAGGPFETRYCSGGQIYYDGTLIRHGFRVAEVQERFSFVLLGRSDFFAKFVPSFHWDESPPWFEIEPAPATGKK
jgi:hypothetical protein